ncbi:hypothetical protein FN846DRAFT_932255, partial [Sphaerosporella brunnea]
MAPRHTLGVLDADTDEVPGMLHSFAISTSTERTADGIILVPQPDESPNDPLNWPGWRRDCALLSLGWHCMMGGGQTPILAAGFTSVHGYSAGVVLFLAASVWAAASKSMRHSRLARDSPCESLPSATHWRDLHSSLTSKRKGWRWAVWIRSIVVGLSTFILCSLFVTETFGTDTPRISRTKREVHDSHAVVEKDFRPQTETPISAEIEHRITDGGRHATFAEPMNEKHEEEEDGGVIEEVPAREVYQMDHGKTSRESLDHYVRTEGLKPVEGRKQQTVAWWKSSFPSAFSFAYPAVGSTVVYAFSIGWLIVLSESVGHIYQTKLTKLLAARHRPRIPFYLHWRCDRYTAVAERVSDIHCQVHGRRNGGIYEP